MTIQYSNVRYESIQEFVEFQILWGKIRFYDDPLYSGFTSIHHIEIEPESFYVEEELFSFLSMIDNDLWNKFFHEMETLIINKSPYIHLSDVYMKKDPLSLIIHNKNTTNEDSEELDISYVEYISSNIRERDDRQIYLKLINEL